MKLFKKAGLALAFLVNSGFTAQAGPPFLTDDPEPVEYRRWEVYLAATYIRDKDQKSGTLPQVEINYGLLPDLQVHLIAPFTFIHPKGSTLNYGYGDTELGFKYRFVH
ncbi:MAG: hypothetical protein ACM3IL_01745, partial [Deltaproteobacteria bacterium]